MIRLSFMELETIHTALRQELWLPVAPGALEEGKAQLWGLVLEARAVHCRIVRSDNGWHVVVPASFYDRAVEEVRLFEEENRNWPPPAPPVRTMNGNVLATLSVLFLLATFHNITRLDVTLPGHPPLDWLTLGSADAEKIMDGQWWRAVTALTLHANLPHLVGNLAIGGVLVILLCREIGPGLAWSLILGSGILGNLVNALLHSTGHISVGASTAVFGAVGILASSSVVRHRHHLQRRWPLPVAAGLALLAVLGTEGEHTDLGAHLFGFLWGIALGAVAEYLIGRFGEPGPALNAVLAVASAVGVVFSWWVALAAAP
ncbi:rhomboid family intramembrane serine protease [Geobacter hydrogenophilus]|uniref:Rhomboid family intramembrane serine protease n=2 Tax=Geobacter hydrogenophilus TaxID=40983 RepID=A0A9W6G3I8_9BACT|nr:rhomboid family intramembrane serine protease [Geobacter hydrogenophilus]MBT0892450.1 rhomboid family intramembrane serine protease [Geobacter hydrogenophilus]GLI39846.1 rhomboid family intramembrane serine protease [Geobacter hydrogenophilus]